MSIAAIVVARGGSVRLPRKNLLPVNGVPLIVNKVQQLRELETAGIVSAVYINTDDEEIRGYAMHAGAVALEGKDYSSDANLMIADSCQQVAEDVVLWAHPTNPLVKPETYRRALAMFVERQRMPHTLRHDSLVSVTPMKRHAWFGNTPLNHQPWCGYHQVGAELMPVFFQDGAIFIQPREQMLANRSFYGKTPYLFEMNASESVDIDTEADYRIALALQHLV